MDLQKFSQTGYIGPVDHVAFPFLVGTNIGWLALEVPLCGVIWVCYLLNLALTAEHMHIWQNVIIEPTPLYW